MTKLSASCAANGSSIRPRGASAAKSVAMAPCISRPLPSISHSPRERATTFVAARRTAKTTKTSIASHREGHRARLALQTARIAAVLQLAADLFDEDVHLVDRTVRKAPSRAGDDLSLRREHRHILGDDPSGPPRHERPRQRI